MDKVPEFLEFLADRKNNFAVSLEKLALKKLSNNEVFKFFKNSFEIEMDNKIFKQNNTGK